MINKKIALLLLCITGAAHAAENGTPSQPAPLTQGEQKLAAALPVQQSGDNGTGLSLGTSYGQAEQKRSAASRQDGGMSMADFAESVGMASDEYDKLLQQDADATFLITGAPQHDGHRVVKFIDPSVRDRYDDWKKLLPGNFDQMAERDKQKAGDYAFAVVQEVATQHELKNVHAGRAHFEAEHAHITAAGKEAVASGKFYTWSNHPDNPDNKGRDKKLETQNIQKSIRAAVAARLATSGTKLDSKTVEENVDKVAAIMIQQEAFKQLRPGFIERVTDVVVEEAAAAIAKPITNRIEAGAEHVLSSSWALFRKYVWAPCTASKEEREDLNQLEKNIEKLRRLDQLDLLLQTERLIQLKEEKIAETAEEIKAADKAAAEKDVKAPAKESKKPAAAPAA